MLKKNNFAKLSLAFHRKFIIVPTVDYPRFIVRAAIGTVGIIGLRQKSYKRPKRFFSVKILKYKKRITSKPLFIPKQIKTTARAF